MAIKGLEKARKNMRKRAKDFAGGKPYKETGEILAASIKKNVEAGGRPKWKPHKYQYSHPILDKTGKMRDDAEITALSWQRQGKWMVNKVLGPFYGAIHQYTGIRTKIGGSIKKIVRKYVVVQDRERERMRDTFRKAFLRK
jgi:phage gpG-like protein